MKKRSNNLMIVFGFIIIIIALVFTFYGINNKPTKSTCVADECLQVSGLEYPAGELPLGVKNSLDLAIMDEYKAHAFYQRVIEKFGSVRPFSMIIRSEEQHISSLSSLYDKYGLEIPKDDLYEKISAPATLNEACKAGVDAEIENADLYEKQLLPVVKSYPDITSIYNNLMIASRNKHLVAFQKCA